MKTIDEILNIEKLSNDLSVINEELEVLLKAEDKIIFEVGRRLIHVKEKDLIHGEWLSWLKERGINERIAQMHMKIYKELNENASTYSHLGLNALYLIATFDEYDRNKEYEINGKTKKLEEMTVKELKAIKKRIDEEIEKNTEFPMSAELIEITKEIKELDKEHDESINKQIEIYKELGAIVTKEELESFYFVNLFLNTIDKNKPLNLDEFMKKFELSPMDIVNHTKIAGIKRHFLGMEVENVYYQ